MSDPRTPTGVRSGPTTSVAPTPATPEATGTEAAALEAAGTQDAGTHDAGTEAAAPEAGCTADGGTAVGGATAGAGTPAGGSSLRVGLLVSRARAAARSGDLDGAVRLLSGSGADGERDVLDLLARVHAQRGELTAAAVYWRRVQEHDERDPAAAAGLARIERLGRRGARAALGRHRTRAVLAAAVCVVAVVTAGTVAVIDSRDTGGGRPAPPRAGRVSPAERAGRLARQLDAEHRAEQARAASRESARRAAAATTLARALRAPGLRPVVHGDSVEVAFTQGLFSEGAELTRSGAEQLAVLGKDLANQRARVEIYGQAATVPGAPRSGGSVLSLWRALIAARELSAASGEPLTAFTTASADQRDAPFAGAARNRTVTVVITPR